LAQINPIPAVNIPQELLQELEDFRKLCTRRYLFNSRADNCLNILGLLISIGIVAAGVYKQSEYAALLGGVMTAIVSAQRAFPFNQRWNFYRLLDSQAENLLTEAKNGVVTIEQTIATVKAMRLDFAQQIPRGSSFRSDSGANIDTSETASASAATSAH
jgi:hypothetical protein